MRSVREKELIDNTRVSHQDPAEAVSVLQNVLLKGKSRLMLPPFETNSSFLSKEAILASLFVSLL